MQWAEGQNMKWKENEVKMLRAPCSCWRHRHKLIAACFLKLRTNSTVMYNFQQFCI